MEISHQICGSLLKFAVFFSLVLIWFMVFLFCWCFDGLLWGNWDGCFDVWGRLGGYECEKWG